MASLSRKLPLFLTLCLVLGACSDQSGQKDASGSKAGERPPSPVSVIILKKSVNPLTTVLSGRAEAYKTADIRPRVGGIIKQIAVKEGSFVKAGDLLYKIDDATYKASVDQYKAALEKAEAAIPSAESNVQRYERLANSGASQKDYEDAQTTLAQDKAAVAEAKADLETAQINLDWTDVRAPFDGVTSATNYSVGNIVTASQTDSLMTLRQIDPIYIQLNESSLNLMRLRDAIAAGNQKRKAPDIDRTDIRLTMEDGTEYPYAGKLDMSEMAVSTTTGTVSIRTLFKNPQNLILPGMYVRATITIGQEEGYLIPQRAASHNANGDLTAKFVTKDNKVETRTFRNSRISGNNWLVTEGVADGDKLIVDGFQWITENQTVKPVLSRIDDQGFVVPEQQAAGSSDGKAKAP
ncbi:efflux RND transporter periplasmic adaptor subunit [Allorhizobium sp. BGMRC 0089]|uniref:efflux RND transporter periplasmic adaptor subunit n=1 Tax=Allorhizobium sonneratiae TaxID=2934936 RepID=UPI00203394A5|nr:efflux RND transporter periplasmic adaptor subunit [Allorhizobium sonneratiae]MCM2294720.1 efflux RND transporter periplasmic adaptor subunit [Allorhizobium sonneratiae]